MKGTFAKPEEKGRRSNRGRLLISAKKLLRTNSRALEKVAPAGGWERVQRDRPQGPDRTRSMDGRLTSVTGRLSLQRKSLIPKAIVYDLIISILFSAVLQKPGVRGLHSVKKSVKFQQPGAENRFPRKWFFAGKGQKGSAPMPGSEGVGPHCIREKQRGDLSRPATKLFSSKGYSFANEKLKHQRGDEFPSLVGFPI